MQRWSRGWAALLVAGSSFAVRPAPVAAETIYFPHQDARFLYPYQRNGGAAFVPAEASPERSLPLVVFLHGSNPTPELHLWLGGGGRDLRPLAERLIQSRKVSQFVLAGPSHTKHAGLARTVWRGFDLALFVEDVARATAGRVRIERRRVVFVGHSGAGCTRPGAWPATFGALGTCCRLR